MVSFFKKYGIIFFLGGLFLFFLTNNIIVLSFDTFPIALDEYDHYQLSKDLYYHVTHSSFLRVLRIFSCLETDIFPLVYPPLIDFVGMLMYFFSGGCFSPLLARLSNMFYMVLLIYSLYVIPRDLGSKYWKEVSALATVLTLFHTYIYSYSRVYMPAFALVGMSVYAVFLLMRCEEFSHKTYSFLFGFVFGLGMLTKQTFVLYIAGALLLSVCLLAYYVWRGQFFRLVNFAIAMLIALVMCLPWYTAKIVLALDRILHLHHEVGYNFYWDRFVAYLTYLSENLIFSKLSVLYVVGAVLFFFNLFVCIKRGAEVKKRGYLISWIIFPVIILPFVFAFIHKRYILPIIPVLNILVALGLVEIWHGRFFRKLIKIRYGLYGGIVVFLGWSFFVTNYKPLENNKGIELLHDRIQVHGILQAREWNFSANKFLDLVEPCCDPDRDTRLIFIPNNTLMYVLETMLLERPELRVSPYIILKTAWTAEGKKAILKTDFEKLFLNSHIVVTKDKGDFWFVEYYQNNIVPFDGKAIFDAFDKVKNKFTLIGRIDIKNKEGSSLLIYKNNMQFKTNQEQ